MAILILISFFLWVLFLHTFWSRSFWETILKSFLITFTLIVLSTELLSIFNKVIYSWIAVFWVTINTLLIMSIALNWKKTLQVVLEWKRSIQKAKIGNIRVLTTLAVISIGLILSLTFIVAIKSPPNNFDSMTYHMARIPHWIQNQNVNYYPTAIERQNYSMPFAEFAILQIQILSRNDTYANLVQWSSYVFSIVATILIAGQSGISSRGKWLIGTLSAAIPMAILQSTSTQNDLVVTVFCLSFAYFLREFLASKRLEDAVFTSISLGLALGTKGTAYIFCAGIGLGIAAITYYGSKIRSLVTPAWQLSLIILLGLSINSGIYIRNFVLEKNPLNGNNSRTVVGNLSPQILGSNLLRNAAVHLSIPYQPFNDNLRNGISLILGDQTENPASTFQGTKFELSFHLNEDDSGNILHFIFLLLALAAFPFLNKNKFQEMGPIQTALILSVLLFSLFLKWQPWGGRLLTPVFFLGCILIGYTIDVFFKKDFIPGLIVIVFFLASTPYLLFNSIRPILPFWENDSVFYDTQFERSLILGLNNQLDRYPALKEQANSILSIFYEGRSVLHTDRRELYFLGNFINHDPYRGATHLVRNLSVKTVGLIMDSNDWEYPLWVFLRQHAGQGQYQIYHLEVDNESGSITRQDDPYPNIIILTRDDFDISNYSDYEEIFSSAQIKVFHHK